jgi:hypothetical protein
MLTSPYPEDLTCVGNDSGPIVKIAAYPIKVKKYKAAEVPIA